MDKVPITRDSLTSTFPVGPGVFSTSDPSAHASSMWPDFFTSAPGRPVRVIVIDDDPHIRNVIVGELVMDQRIDLVGQAGSLREGRKLIRTSDFDVMIVDLNLGDGTGFTLIEYMKTKHSQAEAIVLSVMDNDDRALRAFEVGATGYLIKNSWFGSFTNAVLQVFNGGAPITPTLARRLLRRLEQPSVEEPASKRTTAEYSVLSTREREVLRLIARGHSCPDIADRLSLSAQTVNTHIRNIYRKLQVRSRGDAVNVAMSQLLL